MVVPPQSHAAPLVVALSAPSGIAGAVILVTATGAANPAGTPCTITGSITGLVTSATAQVSDGAGNVAGSFKVGTVAAPAGGGNYVITVTCVVGAVIDSGTANFAVDPSLTVSPPIGVSNQVISVSGKGFWSDQISCTLAGGAVLAGSATCSIGGGSMTGQFTVDPAVALGPYNLVVTPSDGVPQGAVNFANVFQKVASPTILVTPGTVPAGFGTADGTVTITGGGFVAASAGNCQVTETGGTPIIATSPAPTCSISSSGTVTGSFAVPRTAPVGGPYTIRVTATANGATADFAFFNVAGFPQLIAAAPLNGPAGTLVVLASNAGFPFAVEDGGVCTISSTPPTPALVSVPTCFIDPTTGLIAVGNFVVSGTAVGQAYIVRVTGLHGDYAETPFTVTPSVTLNPTSGSPPVAGSPGAPATEVTVTGTGFSVADSSCTITAPAGMVIDISGEPACTVGGGVLTAKFKVGAGSTYLAAGYAITVTGTPAADTPAVAPIFVVQPQIVVSPNYGPSGVLVNVGGSGFDPTAGTCTPSTNPAGLDGGTWLCTMNVDGTIVATFTVAVAAPNGNYTITIFGTAAGADEDSALFSKTASMNLLPTSGAAGTVVLASGTGFAAGDTGCSIISQPSGLISNPLCTVAAGSMSGSFTVAAGSGGTYLVRVIGTTGDEGRATFTVPPAATLTLNPIQGQVGTAVSATGSNYQGTTCLITAAPSGLFTSQSCSIVAGSLTGSFAVAPSALAGTLYTVTVETNAGAVDSTTATFAVTAGATGVLTLTPSSGPVGTVVSGTASGFPTDTSCVLISAPSGMLYFPTCILSGGSAVVGFSVSSSADAGSYMVLVVGNTGRSASATFTVGSTPSFTLSVNPSSLVLSPGGVGTVTVTVLSAGTFNSPVTLAATMPSGVTGGFSPNPLTPPAGGSVTSILSIGISSATPSTTTTIEITATSGSMTAHSSVSLVVQVFVSTTSTSISTSTTLSTTTAPWNPGRPCIIATVTFGSEVSWAVQLLRNFRDGLVLSTRAGSAFMEVFNAWYYSFSPTVANFISTNGPLRDPVRVMLYPLLGILSVSTMAYSVFGATPELGVVIAGLVASSLIGLVYFTIPALMGVHALLRKRRLDLMRLAKISLASLAIALTMLAIGEIAGSFLLLAVASSAVVLTCVIAVPVLLSTALLRPSRK